MTKSSKSAGSRLSNAIVAGKLPLPDDYAIPEERGHRDSFTTVRQANYRDKTVRVETTYRITINEEPVRAHTRVLDDGSVHCHSFPNYSFPSAMDLARKIVDASFVPIPNDELGESRSYNHGGHV